MIKKTYYVIITLFSISPLLYAMNLDLKDVQTAMFVTDTIAAVGSYNGCFLLHNPLKDCKSIECLHHFPTHDLIVDKKKKLVGALCKDRFIVYDIEKKKKIWSQTIYNDPHYSAAFSTIDDTIFLCQNNELRSNKGLIITLPYTGSDKNLNILCHPKENKLLYICSDNTLSIKSLDKNKKTIRHQPDIEYDDYIYRIFYSPSGNSIGIQTNKKGLYIYYPSTKKTQLVNTGLCPCYTCFRVTHMFFFLPKTESIIAFLSNEITLSYVDVCRNQILGHVTIKKSLDYYPINKHSKPMNVLDFSPSSVNFITSLYGMRGGNNGVYYLSRIIYTYFALKNFLTISDIVKLISKSLYNILLKQHYYIHIDYER